LIADGSDSLEDEHQLLSASVRVLLDWPKNFIALLLDIGKQLQPSANGGIRRQFESIFGSLFKNRAINPSEQTDFLRVAFLEFAENYWDRGYVDPKLLKHARETINRRFVTQSVFAAQVGIHNLTASRLLKDQKIPSKRVQCGRSERILVDFSCNTLCAKMSETSGPGTITVGRGKKSHFDNHKQDKQFFRCVGSFGA
jgi:hypothetical protein